MQETTVARNYAGALFELAQADAALERYVEQLGRIADLVESEKDFRLFLETPRIEPSAKKDAIREVFEGRIPDRLLRFLFVVIDKRRARILPEIADEFAGMVNEHFGRLKVDITTASEPDKALKADLKQRLGRLLDREILPRYRVNPRIIGGVIVRVGDRIMDGSIRHRLQLLRRSLLKAEIG
jgi:F-type H+-transporting ATPase subunit delta